MLNNQGVLDVRNVLTGKDGQLYITTSDGNQMFLAEVDTFQAQMNIANTDYQPIGSILSMAVNTGVSVTVTFSEAIIRDDVMLESIYKDLANGIMPSFDFQGKLARKTDGQEQRQVFRNCVPDGTVDLMNITPGEILKRQWSFRANSMPEMLDYFKS